MRHVSTLASQVSVISAICTVALVAELLAAPALAQQTVSPPGPQTVQSAPVPQPTSQATPARPAAAQPAPAEAARANQPEQSPEVLLGGGELLEITVFGAPEFTKEVRVSSDGKIALPMIGEVPVAGLTIREAEKRVSQRLSEGGFFNDPQVSVMVKEFTTQGISILGEVQKPGIYPLLGSRTLNDAISAAGGVTPRAGKLVTITHRGRANSEAQTLTLSWQQEDAAVTNNPKIVPGDTIIVSKAGIVYVVGDVKQPNGFVMENADLTVLQAIAMAQGTNPTAALNDAKLIRKSANGRKQIPLPLRKMLEARVADVRLQADDIIFVPNSRAKSAAHRGLEMALQAATGIAIRSRGY